MANLRVDNLTGTGGRNAIDGSVFFNERYTRLELDGSSDLAFGTGDFTIEMWIKIDDDTNTNTIYDSRPAGSNGAQVALFYSGSSNAILFAHGGSLRITGTIDVGADHSWHHIALTRASGSTKLFVDGIQDGSTYSSDTTDYLNPSNRPRIGSSSGSTDLSATSVFKGYISNVRVNKGSALYTATFTPPTEKLTAIDGTVLLCCQDFDNPLQEATGKTITAYGNLQTFDDTNILTNGGFTSDISGWTVAQGTIAWNAGKAHMTGTSGNSLEQNVTTVVGKRYRLTATVDNTANTGANAGITFGGTLNYVSSDTITTGSKTFTIDLTATSTSTLVDLWGGTAVTGYWSDATVKLIDPPKAPKVLPPVGIDEGVTFEGDTKVNSQGYMYFPTGDTSQRGRGRGLMGGGTTPNTNSITFVNIQSGGTAQNFGALTSARFGLAAFSSSTRGIFVGGATPTRLNEMEYVTIATQSNAVDFGNLEQNVRDTSAGGNNLYGFRGGGAISPAGAKTNMIDKTTIASKGNATDIGNLESNKQTLGACASPTRCVWGGGFWPANINAIQYITIASAGDTVDFGDLTNARSSLGSASSNTRGLWGGGSGPTNIIDYVELATTGNAQDFGDLTLGRTQLSATSNSIRAVFCGGYWSSSDRNIIDYVDIATTGNAKDFGDINRADNDSNREHGVCSDSHGGLS